MLSTCSQLFAHFLGWGPTSDAFLGHALFKRPGVLWHVTEVDSARCAIGRGWQAPHRTQWSQDDDASALMGRGGAMPSNISSPRYLPALVVSLVNWVINAIISSSHFRRKPLQETELDRRLRPLGVRELSGDVERDR